MDKYRYSWALRCLREARAELEAAKKMPYMALSLALEAVRKAKNAIYYSLGEPTLVEGVVKEILSKTHDVNDPILRCLINVEETVQHITEREVNGERAVKHADILIQVATDIVKTMTGEKLDD